MAVENLNFLQIVQETFIEAREAAPTNLSSPITRVKEVMSAVRNIYSEICSLNNGHMKFLEADGTITLATGDRDYALATNVKEVSYEGWIMDGVRELTYRDYPAFINRYKDITETGTPESFTIWGNQALIALVPTATYNTKTIIYPYWKQADALTSDSDVPLIPNEFRRRCLIFGAVAHLLQTDGDVTYKLFWDRYMGGIEDLKRSQCSIKPTVARVTHIF
jgi:hypothetical protein